MEALRFSKMRPMGELPCLLNDGGDDEFEGRWMRFGGRSGSSGIRVATIIPEGLPDGLDQGVLTGAVAFSTEPLSQPKSGARLWFPID